MTQNLFSYGTLQLESIQLKTFGRILKGHPDNITGYKIAHVKIKDQPVEFTKAIRKFLNSVEKK